MLPISAVVRRGGSGTDGVLAADVAVLPPEEEALRTDEALLGSGAGCLRADGGFIGWLGTRMLIPREGAPHLLYDFAGRKARAYSVGARF